MPLELDQAPVELTVVRHVHFWLMARDIRNYCRATCKRVLSNDNQESRTVGYATDLPETDLLYREWRIRLTDVSRTANRLSEAGAEFAGLTDEERVALLQHVKTPWGRVTLAEILSGSSV